MFPTVTSLPPRRRAGVAAGVAALVAAVLSACSGDPLTPSRTADLSPNAASLAIASVAGDASSASASGSTFESATGRGCLYASTGPYGVGNVTAAAVVTCAPGAATQTWTAPASGGTGAITLGGDVCLTGLGPGLAYYAVGAMLCDPAATTQRWTYTAAGELRLPTGVCATALETGAVSLRTCDGSAAQRWTRPGAAAPAPTVAVGPATVALAVGGTAALTATVGSPVAGGVLTWSSRNPAVASVAPSGAAAASVTAVGAGTTYIVATYTAGSVTVRDSAAVSVTAPTAPTTPTQGAGALQSATGRGCLYASTGPYGVGNVTAAAVVTCAPGAATQTWTAPASGATGAITLGGDVCLTGLGPGLAYYAVGAMLCDPAATTQRWTYTAAGELRLPTGVCATALETGAVSLRTCDGSAAQRWTRPGTTAPTPAPTNPTPPTTPTLPSGSAAVFALMGATPSVAAVEARGGIWAKYEQNFRTWEETHWKADGVSWENANHYDRAMIHYVWWARTGNATYLQRAHAYVLDYRTRYVEGSNYQPNQAYAEMDGIALHYLITGDPKSLTAIGRVADNYSEPGWIAAIGNTAGNLDPRVQAKILSSLVLASYLKAPSARGRNWNTVLPQVLEQILKTQSPDGGYRWSHHCYADKPFMSGLLNDAMIRYYTLFSPDPRIVATVRRSVDFLWSKAWIPASASMAYLTDACTEAPAMTAAPEGNMFVVGAFGFVAKHTGISSYLTQGDIVFAGGVNGSWYNGSKHFNQIHTSSYRYLQYRW